MRLGKDENIRQAVNLDRERVAIHGGTGTGKSYRVQQLVEGWSGQVVALGVEQEVTFPESATVVASLDTNQVTLNPGSAISAIVSAVAHAGGTPLLIVADLKEWTDEGLTSALVAATGAGATLVATGQKLSEEITEAVECIVETRPGFEVEVTRH